jgi:tRNA dimethylallyltransferase
MKLPVLLGPTAVGKTELAVKLASLVDGEIVSADSRQVYRLMDIGTAKPTRKDLRAVPHHMIDIADPDMHFGAGQYGTLALSVLDQLRSRGKMPLVVGGSGLYIRALVEGLFPAPTVDESLRREILRQARRSGTESLHRRLGEVDPESAKKIHPNDLQRISRALEVYEQTGTPISRLQDGAGSTNLEPLYIGLNRNRKELFHRIESRLRGMVRAGFVEEVSSLLARGYSPELNSFRAVGYREMADHIAGKITLGEAVFGTSKRTKGFARRQLTWFRSLKGVSWVDLSDLSETDALNRVAALIHKQIDEG